MKTCIKQDIASHLGNNILYFSLLIVIYLSCISCNANAQSKNTLHTKDSLENQILNGNTDAYNTLSENVYGIKLLPYALLMASSYDYGIACYDVYTIIVDICDKHNLYIDSLLLETAVNYLKKGAGLNNWNCCIELSYLYKKGMFVEKSEQKSLFYLEKARKNKGDVFIEFDEP